MSELNNQFSKFINSVTDYFFIFWELLKNLFNSAINEVNFGYELKVIWSQLTEYLTSIFEIIFNRIDLELTDIKIIFNSFSNSLSTNGKITASIILVVLVILVFIIFYRPQTNRTNKKDIKNKIRTNSKTKSKRTQLLEIEIDLLELQDKYSRRIISLNSYKSEAKRLEAKVGNIV
ncbi:MAG: hypothetical protein ACJ0BU_10485 [Candidatus Puniceispirillales bacterium]